MCLPVHYLPIVLVLVSLSSWLANADWHCSEDFLSEAKRNNVTQHCNKKVLGVEFAWNYYNESRRLEVIVGAKLVTDTGWLAWGLNPDGPQMAGTRAIIGIKREDGTLYLDKYNVTDGTKRGGCPLLPSQIDLNVSDLNFSYLKRLDYYIMHAAVILPFEYNSSRVSHVWEIGPLANGKRPRMHLTTLDNLGSAETIDLISGKVHSISAPYRSYLRTVHGILNIVGWGTLLPVGVIVARYFRTFPIKWKWWFRIHISCQITGFIIGSIGFTIGLILGEASKNYTFLTHRILAIFIFTFTIIQGFALRLRPEDRDEFRNFWNMYHHFLGYALLTLIAINNFKGIAILKPEETWKWAYIAVLVSFGATVLALETFTWIKFCWGRKKDKGPADVQNGRDTGHGSSGTAVQPVTDQTGQDSQKHDLT